MRFAFKNPLSGLLLDKVFAETATSLVDAFVGRAQALEHLQA
jgi:ribosome-associated toxin RatA of RatAB toxin-antitoxin module